MFLKSCGQTQAANPPRRDTAKKGTAEMKITKVMVVAAGLTGLAACNKNPVDNQASQIQANADNRADNVTAAANNQAANIMNNAENKSDAIKSAAENKADAIKNSAKNEAATVKNTTSNATENKTEKK
jgi:hypothetical protein